MLFFFSAFDCASTVRGATFRLQRRDNLSDAVVETPSDEEVAAAYTIFASMADEEAKVDLHDMDAVESALVSLHLRPRFDGTLLFLRTQLKSATEKVLAARDSQRWAGQPSAEKTIPTTPRPHCDSEIFVQLVRQVCEEPQAMYRWALLKYSSVAAGRAAVQPAVLRAARARLQGRWVSATLVASQEDLIMHHAAACESAAEQSPVVRGRTQNLRAACFTWSTGA